MRTDNKGFTLLEILCSVVILTVGVMGVMWAFSSGMLAGTDVENVNLALNLAQAKAEELKDTAFADLSDSGPSPDPEFPDFSTEIDVAEGEDPMQIDIIVSWETKSGQSEVTLTTLRADY